MKHLALYIAAIACSIAPASAQVTSVGLSPPPGIMSVTGSPITSSGTLGLSMSSQSTNTVLAAPNGSSGTPTFRSLAQGDLPSITTTGTTTAISIPDRFSQVINLKDMGGKCDGVTNDATAIQAWLNKAAPGVALVAPAGKCLYGTAVSVTGANRNSVALIGAGPGATIFTYTGANTSNDTWTIGDGANNFTNWWVSGIKWDTTTVMSAGALVRFRGVQRSQVSNVIFEGQDGSQRAYDGVYFNGIDQISVSQFEAGGTHDCLIVDGVTATGLAGLQLMQGKVGGCLGGAGIHIAGGHGGFFCDQVDIISNDIGILIDNAKQALTNREVFMGTTCDVDSSVHDGVRINDPLSGSMSVTLAGWIASTSSGNGVNVVKMSGGKLSISSPQIWNNPNGDGIRIQDATTFVGIGTNTLIYNNGGYGVNATVATNNITPGKRPFANTSGTYSLNSHIEYFGSYTGYMKHPDGMIEQWGYANITGAANTFLIANVTFPLVFPNAATQAIAFTGGFANGAQQMTSTIQSATTTGGQIILVSSGAVVGAQPVNYHVWGY